MEIEKERKMEDTTESCSSIPLDLTIDILLRVPAKSIGRFRCMLKLWSSMTTTPSFVKSFSVHSSARPCLISFKNEEDKRIFHSFPHHHDDDPGNCYNTRAERYQMILPKEETGLPLRNETVEYPMTLSDDIPQSIHGLISFGYPEIFIIWNPTLRQHVTLPEPKVSKPLISLLGYDPIGDEYKVLCMSLCEDARNNGEDPQIFTMGAGESWRRLIQNIPSPIHCQMRNWRCIKGVVYYLRADKTIVSFDVRSEKFGVIQIPEIMRSTMTIISAPIVMGSGFIRRRGRLALFFNYCTYSGQVTLWVLEDAENHEWSREDSILPFETLWWTNAWSVLLLSGETADDELIYLPTFTNGPFYAIYYNSERNNVRKVWYDGIGQNRFRPHCFPNHTESLVPLNNLLAGT